MHPPHQHDQIRIILLDLSRQIGIAQFGNRPPVPVTDLEHAVVQVLGVRVPGAAPRAGPPAARHSAPMPASAAGHQVGRLAGA